MRFEHQETQIQQVTHTWAHDGKMTEKQKQNKTKRRIP